MSNEIILNKEEAVKVAVKFWGCDATIVFGSNPRNYVLEITGMIIMDIEEGRIKSFQIKLRGIDEMTEAEKTHYESLQEKFTYYGEYADVAYEMYLENSKSLDYLRENGFDTDGIKDKTILIK